MEARKFTFVLLLLGGVVASFILVPAKHEQALMLLKDRQFAEAEIYYEELRNVDSTKRDNLIPLTQIHLNKGETSTVIQLYENYLGKYPDDIEVWDKLMSLYRETMRPYDLVNALEQVVKNHPALKYYSDLVQLYERLGVNDERLLAALGQVVTLDPARDRDSLKLALLLAAKGNINGASTIMDDYVSRFPEKINNKIAELNLRLLLSSDRVAEAFAWAEQWLGKNKDLTMRYAALLYSRGQTDNLDVALLTTKKIEVGKMPSWLISAVMKSGWDNDRHDFLETFVSRLDDEVVDNYPVVMAGLAFKRKDMAGMNKWLAVAENRSDLTLHQQAELMNIYFSANQTTKGMTLLAKLAQQPEVSSMMLTEATPYILKSGRIDEALAIFQTMREQGNADSKIDQSWALFAAAGGKTKQVSEWLATQDNNQLSREKLHDIYYTAIDRSHYDLAAVLGRRMYSEYKDADNARLLLRALLGMDRNDAVRSELATLLQDHRQYFNFTRKEQRELAFQLLQAGDKQAAIKEFMRLARSEGPQGKNVQQLLYLWGAMPGETALNWLEARARVAPSNEIAGWWQHLVQAGGAERVIAFAGYLDKDLPAKAQDIYLTALSRTGDLSALDRQLQHLAQKSGNSARLKEFAAQATYAGLPTTADAIWQKVYEIEPNDTKAIRALGIAAFNRGDMLKAENYLTQLTSLLDVDWETAFYLGEVYSAYERKEDAAVYYRKSLRLIDKGSGDDKRKELARAYLDYRLGNIKQAMNIYQKLIESYPDDLDVRATYSAILIDEGQLEIASSLLGDR